MKGATDSQWLLRRLEAEKQQRGRHWKLSLKGQDRQSGSAVLQCAGVFTSSIIVVVESLFGSVSAGGCGVVSTSCSGTHTDKEPVTSQLSPNIVHSAMIPQTNGHLRRGCGLLRRRRLGGRTDAKTCSWSARALPFLILLLPPLRTACPQLYTICTQVFFVSMLFHRRARLSITS